MLFVTTLDTIVSFVRSIVTTRLPASVTKSQRPETRTPLGPDRLLSAAVPFAFATTPANPPVMFLTKVFVRALTTSTLALERSAR